MKYYLLPLTLSTLLVACGSSSSDSTTKTDTPNDSTTTPAESKISGFTSATKVLIGEAPSVKENTAYNTNVMNEIMVDGTKVTLIPPGFGGATISMPGMAGVNGDGFARLIKKYAYSTSGVLVKYITDENNNATGATGTAFSHGLVTQNLPTGNNITYKGSAVAWGQGVKEGTADFEEAENLEAVVNFDDKSLVMTQESNKVDLTGKISGSSFDLNGTINTDEAQGKGNFYGPNAEELGGTMASGTKSYSFGAKKQ